MACSGGHGLLLLHRSGPGILAAGRRRRQRNKSGLARRGGHLGSVVVTRGLANWAPLALGRATWAASRPLAAAWWALVAVRSLLPAGLTLGLGSLVSAIEDGRTVTGPLLLVGGSFALLSMSSPIHTQVGSILGDRTSGSLQARLTDACSDPPGIATSSGLAWPTSSRWPATSTSASPARRSRSRSGSSPPGWSSCSAARPRRSCWAPSLWWAPFVIGGGLAARPTGCSGESSVWANRTDPEVMAEQRHADYAYRLAVEAGPAKEVRVFGLGGWVVDRFAHRPPPPRSTSSGRPCGCASGRCSIVFAVLGVAHAVVLVPLVAAAIDGDLGLATLVVAAQALRRRERPRRRRVRLGARGRGPAGRGGRAARGRMGPRRSAGRAGRHAGRAAGMPAHEIRFRRRRLHLPERWRAGLRAPRPHDPGRPVARHRRPQRRRQDDAGQAAVPALRPDLGGDHRRRHDLRAFDVDEWRERVAVVFQDFVRFELSLRRNLVPDGRPRCRRRPARTRSSTSPGPTGLADLDQVLSKA